MNEKKKENLRKKLSDVPNPPVPNRAHTEMSIKNLKTFDNKKESASKEK